MAAASLRRAFPDLSALPIPMEQNANILLIRFSCQEELGSGVTQAVCGSPKAARAGLQLLNAEVGR